MDENQNLSPTYLPQKVKNWPLYIYRVFAKVLALIIFAAGTILLSIVAFPVLKIIFHPKKNFRYHARHLVYVLFSFFMKFMGLLGILTIKVDKKKYLKNLKSAVIVANHPGYLDSAIMLSLLPHAGVIAKASLSKRDVMAIVIRELYMPNSMPYDQMLARSKEDLAYGNTIVIFPEGTRSTKFGQHKFKKGAARIALASGCPVIPVYIGGTDKLGLGKGDKVLQYNHTQKYIYDLRVKDAIYPDEFKDLPEPVAAKRMTAKIREALSDEANSESRY